jgi:Amt family ammonium transporter
MMAQSRCRPSGVLTTVVWSGVVSFSLLQAGRSAIGMRVPEEDERIGLDVTSHGERAYND